MLAHISTCNMWLANRSLIGKNEFVASQFNLLFKRKKFTNVWVKYVPLEYISVVITNSLFCCHFVIGYKPTVLKKID